MDRGVTINVRKVVEDEIRRDKGYLKILDMLEGRDKTRFKEYYRGRIHVAEKILQILDELESENENK